MGLRNRVQSIPLLPSTLCDPYSADLLLPTRFLGIISMVVVSGESATLKP
jgi:hypothetical protein